MKRIRSTAAVIVAAVTQIGASPQTLEGGQWQAGGPAEMCGLAGRDVAELVDRVRTSSQFRATPMANDRFELFANPDHSRQWVVTRPSEPAHPAVTCRHAYEEGGTVRLRRNLSCEGPRDDCDALFREFQALDTELARQMSARARRPSLPIRAT